MQQLDRLKQLKSKIYEIAERHNAIKVYVFGSCARKEETPDSDIDFLVEFNKASLFDHIRLEHELSDFLETTVDVVSIKSLTGDNFARNAQKDMVLL